MFVALPYTFAAKMILGWTHIALNAIQLTFIFIVATLYCIFHKMWLVENSEVLGKHTFYKRYLMQSKLLATVLHWNEYLGQKDPWQCPNNKIAFFDFWYSHLWYHLCIIPMRSGVRKHFLQVILLEICNPLTDLLIFLSLILKGHLISINDFLWHLREANLSGKAVIYECVFSKKIPLFSALNSSCSVHICA